VQIIIFDLDGTLIDTSVGIINSIRYVESKMRLEPIDDRFLIGYIGAPPQKLYMDCYGLSGKDASLAVSYHREYGKKKAIYEAKVYDAIPETLYRIKKMGIDIAVATLKKQDSAEAMLKHYGLLNYFHVIIGMNNEESLSKKDIINAVIKCTGEKNALMIGDSEYDYIGAVGAGIDFLGVTYGYGFNRKSSYCFNTVNAPIEIIDYI